MTPADPTAATTVPSQGTVAQIILGTAAPTTSNVSNKAINRRTANDYAGTKSGMVFSCPVVGCEQPINEAWTIEKFYKHLEDPLHTEYFYQKNTHLCPFGCLKGFLNDFALHRHIQQTLCEESETSLADIKTCKKCTNVIKLSEKRHLSGHYPTGYSIVHFYSYIRYIPPHTGKSESSFYIEETLDIAEGLLAKAIAKEFDNLSSDLENHSEAQDNHKLPDTSKFACYHCDKGFNTLRELFLHMVGGICYFLDDTCINTVVPSKEHDLGLRLPALKKPSRKRAILVYRHSSKSNQKDYKAFDFDPHVEETLDIAEDLFAKGILEGDMELTTIYGNDTKS